MLPLQVFFLRSTVRKMFLSSLTSFFSLSLSNYLSDPSPAPRIKSVQMILFYFPKYPSFNCTQTYASNVATFFIKFSPNILVKWASYLLNAAFTMTVWTFLTVTSCIIIIKLILCWNTPNFPDCFLIYHILQWGWLSWDFLQLSFFHIRLHSVTSSNFDLSFLSWLGK
jgi:hypothetical protein